MFSLNVVASEAVRVRVGSPWKKFRELGGVLFGRQGLSLKQHAEIYQCCVRPVLFCFCKTWELIVAEKLRLHELGWHIN